MRLSGQGLRVPCPAPAAVPGLPACPRLTEWLLFSFSRLGTTSCSSLISTAEFWMPFYNSEHAPVNIVSQTVQQPMRKRETEIAEAISTNLLVTACVG